MRRSARPRRWRVGRVAAMLVSLIISSAACLAADQQQQQQQQQSRQERQVQAAEPAISFRPLKLDRSAGGAIERAESGDFFLMGAGEGTDVAFARNTLCVIKQKGALKPIWRLDELNVWPHSRAWDGRYIWMTIAHHDGRSEQTPFLLVADPAAERTWQLTEKNRLPLAKVNADDSGRTSLPVICPLDEGRAVVAGSTRGRLWVAVVRFNPRGDTTVKMIHEGRYHPNRPEPNYWKQAGLGFNPHQPILLHDGADDRGRPRKRVLFVRDPGLDDNGARRHPLIVDPYAGKAEVMQEEFGGWAAVGTAQEGVYYWMVETVPREPPDSPRALTLWRIGGPDLKQEPVAQLPYPGGREIGHVAIRGGRIFVVNERCLVATVSGTKVGSFKEMPIDWSAIGREERGSLHMLIPSSNYGLLTQSHFGMDRWYQMDVPETKNEPR